MTNYPSKLVECVYHMLISKYFLLRKIDDNGGKAYELGQTTVFGLQGILACWMRQSNNLEAFKQQQHPNHALHVYFDLDTGFEVLPIEEYGHLQVSSKYHSQRSAFINSSISNRYPRYQFRPLDKQVRLF